MRDLSYQSYLHMRKLRLAEAKWHVPKDKIPESGGARASKLCFQTSGACALKNNLDEYKNVSQQR